MPSTTVHTVYYSTLSPPQYMQSTTVHVVYYSTCMQFTTVFTSVDRVYCYKHSRVLQTASFLTTAETIYPATVYFH